METVKLKAIEKRLQMDEKKQIEEMAKYLTHCFMNCAPCEKCRAYIYSEQLYNAGFREQIESEWIFHQDGSATCKHCGTTQKCVWDMDNFQAYCGHCGAKMKGGV